MLKYCKEKWDRNKGRLKAAMESNKSLTDLRYDDFVRMIVEHILNPGSDSWELWDEENITEIDNGDYQGTLLYLIPMKTYQPSEYEYLMTHARYGSCSGCDALEAIRSMHYYDEQTPTADQIKCYMSLCKDLVTSMIKPYNTGWRQDGRFEEVTT